MTITLTREEAQQVLDAMIPYQQKVIATTKEYGVTVSVNNEIETAIEILRARLSAPEPEPVACPKEPENIEELYTAPPQREWQGLTDEEMSAAMDYWSDPVRSAYGGAHSADGEYVGMIDTWQYIEAKLKEKNT